jgi:hypothetical protein
MSTEPVMNTEHVEQSVSHSTSTKSAERKARGKEQGVVEEPVSSPKERSIVWNWLDALYILLILLLVIAMAYRYNPHITTSIPGMWWDPLLNTWILGWDTTALVHHPLQLWHAPLFYPYTLSLSYSENLLGDLIYFAPIYLISHNPVLSYNVTFYSIFFLDGLTMYITARAYTEKRFAALIAALIYAFAPYRLSQIDHIPITGGEWIPLAFLFLDKSFQHGRWRNWILFALFFLLQLLSSVYYGIYLAYMLLAYALVRYARPFFQQLRLHKSVYLKNLLRSAIKPVIVFAAALALIVLLMAPYLVSLHNGYARSVMQSAGYSAFITDFLYTSPFNLLHGITSINADNIPARCITALNAQQYPPSCLALFQGKTPPADSEHYLFLGWTTLVLVIIGIVLAVRQHHTTMRAYAWTALIVLLFAFGPFLQAATGTGAPLMGGASLSHPYLPGMPMPWLLAFYAFPGFKGLRVPARLMGVLLMMLALLSAYAVAWLQGAVQAHAGTRAITDQQEEGNIAASWGKRRSSMKHLAIVFILVIIPAALLLEALPASLPITPVPTGSAIPPVYQWLATHGGTAPVIELPISEPGTNFINQEEAWYDYYTLYQPHPIVDGWSGYRPPITTTISVVMQNFPSPASIAILQRYQIHYVVVHPKLYLIYEQQNEVNTMLAQMQANTHLRLLASFGKNLASGDSVWQVV